MSHALADIPGEKNLPGTFRSVFARGPNFRRTALCVVGITRRSDKSFQSQRVVQGHRQRGIDVLAPLGSSRSRSLADDEQGLTHCHKGRGLGQATPREALMQGSFKFAVSGSSRRFTTEGCNEALPNPMRDDSSKWLPSLDLAPPAMVRVNDGWMLLPPDPALEMIKPGSLLSSGRRALALPGHATC